LTKHLEDFKKIRGLFLGPMHPTHRKLMCIFIFFKLKNISLRMEMMHKLASKNKNN